MNHRKQILKSYSAGVEAVSGYSSVLNSLPSQLFNSSIVQSNSKIRLISIGKAADAMLSAALDLLKERIESALLITKTGHISAELQSDPRIQCIESAHPVPNQASLEAGRQLVKFCALATSETVDIFLISGGASSLVEVLPDNWSLAEYQALTEWMLKNSFSIHQINTVRGRISQIKQGQLWSVIPDHPVLCLMISDVVDNDPSVIGSGLLFATEHEQPTPKKLPKQWRNQLSKKVKQQQGKLFHWQIIANNQQALQATAKKAKCLGYSVVIRPEFLAGDSIEMAKYCCDLSQQHPQQLLIWGAETTVALPKVVGRGGRCQHLALAAAIYLQNSSHTILLAAGTDGGDGSSMDSGALVDQHSVSRIQAKRLDANFYLQTANSGVALEASGDLVTTGLTGTNVMDLVVCFTE
ncbi:MAG: DUF4147 domain-containing protein [Thiotrichaceae bacterium]|nr:DUF4147 domain-containing protein [Thiotrichaceae bacterium]